MRKLALISGLILLCSISKAQCIFIYASEKIKGVEIPITTVEFDVVINDTIKKKAVSKGDGSLGRMSLEMGTYKVKISNPEFEDGISNGVVVKESRSTSVIINLVRLTPAQIEERKKLEKK